MLQLDAGGFADFYGDGGRTKTGALFQIYRRLGVAAVNVTPRELGGNAGDFLAMTRDAPIPLLSANIVDEATGEALFLERLVLEAGGKRVGLIGVTERVLRRWMLADGSALVTADPVERARPLVEALRGECDLLVLLAYIPRWRVRELAEALPGVDVILGSDGVSVSPEPLTVGGAVISYSGRQGEYVGQLGLTGRWDPARYEMVRLTRDLPRDPEIEAMVELVAGELEPLAAGYLR